MKLDPAMACAAFALLGACGSPIVGAECSSGFVLCDGRCVDLDRDAEHCGDCGQACGAFECNAAMCGLDLGDGGSDAGPTDGEELDGEPSDRSVAPEQRRDSLSTPLQPDGGFEFPDGTLASGCGLGSTECGSECADLRSDPGHCGGCGIACGADRFCIAGACVDTCEAPLELCGSRCVDFERDERHCGGCDQVCASGLCEAAVCADVLPGHLIVVGHDYGDVANPTMQRIAGNALFLASGANVRALVYRGSAAGASVTGVGNAINLVAAPNGRSWTQIQADPEQVSTQLAEADAFVIHAQAGASDAELAELARRWSASISQFVLRGGVVVLFETASANNSGSYKLLEPSGLFTAAERGAIASRATLIVQNPGVGVAAHATSTYQSQNTTVRFLDVLSDGFAVVEDSTGEAIVFHRVVVP